jgi:hypothetical protein
MAGSHSTKTLKRLVLATATAAGFAAATSAGAAIMNWPADDEDWHPFLAGGALYSDPVGDINPDWLDIVGDATHAAGYWAYSDAGTPSKLDDEIMWRIRLEEWKVNPNVVWQIFMDESGDNEVELVNAITGGLTFGDVDLNTTAIWSGPIADFSRVITPTGDGSAFGGGGDDAFLDIGMPWATFSALTGASGSQPIRFGLSSSATHSGINKDLPFSLSSSDPVASGFTDPIFGIPEPSTFSMIAAGLLGLVSFARRSART